MKSTRPDAGRGRSASGSIPAALALLIAVSLLTVGSASERMSTQRPEFSNWPAGASPRDVGKRVAENFVARPFERPKGYIIYPEVCTWYGSLTLARLTGRQPFGEAGDRDTATGTRRRWANWST